jgi:hypothetical protein
MAFQQQQQWGGPVFDQGAVMPGAAAFPPLMGGPGADFPSLDGSLDHGAPEIPDDVRPGDWPCPNCGTNCFASKAFCFKCKTSKPGSEGMAPFQGGGKGGSGEAPIDPTPSEGLPFREKTTHAKSPARSAQATGSARGARRRASRPSPSASGGCL